MAVPRAALNKMLAPGAPDTAGFVVDTIEEAVSAIGQLASID